MIKIIDAIFAIDKNAEVTFQNDDVDTLKWDSTPIAKDVIIAKQAEMQAEYDSKQYQRDRKAEYDKLNQFEMQFDDQRDGTTTWVDAINGIKEKYPKE